MAVERRVRPIHRYGVIFRATFRSTAVLSELEATTVFRTDAPQPALVRVSQAFTAHFPLDYIGLAVKVTDVYGPGWDQDFVLVSSPGAPFWRRFPVPVTGALAATFSSGTSYRAGGVKLLFGAYVRPSSNTPLDDLVAAASPAGASVILLAARPRGHWHMVAEISLAGSVFGRDNDIRFSPAAAGGGIEPIGAVNGFRTVLYRYFQRTIEETSVTPAHLALAAEVIQEPVYLSGTLLGSKGEPS
jgi:hypothetical protein